MLNICGRKQHSKPPGRGCRIARIALAEAVLGTCGLHDGKSFSAVERMTASA